MLKDDVSGVHAWAQTLASPLLHLCDLGASDLWARVTDFILGPLPFLTHPFRHTHT